MSLYEVLVFVALFSVGGYAWHLYRKDSSRQSAARPVTGGKLMFGRDRTGPGGKN